MKVMVFHCIQIWQLIYFNFSTKTGVLLLDLSMALQMLHKYNLILLRECLTFQMNWWRGCKIWLIVSSFVIQEFASASQKCVDRKEDLWSLNPWKVGSTVRSLESRHIRHLFMTLYMDEFISSGKGIHKKQVFIEERKLEFISSVIEKFTFNSARTFLMSGTLKHLRLCIRTSSADMKKNTGSSGTDHPWFKICQ